MKPKIPGNKQHGARPVPLPVDLRKPSEWLPSWRGEAAYPPKTAPLLRWVWEFLRRNSEYQFDYITYVTGRNAGPIFYRDGVAFDSQDEALVGADFRCEITQTWRGAELPEKWGLIRGILPPPANSNAWRENEFGIFGHSIQTYGAQHRFISPGITKFTREASLRFNHENEVYTRFDLTEPIAPQAAAIKQLLLQLQRYCLPKRPVRRGRRPALLLRYLRAWDARASGSEIGEIAGTLHHKVANKYPDFLGDHRVQDDLREAKYLIDGGYRTLRLTK